MKLILWRKSQIFEKVYVGLLFINFVKQYFHTTELNRILKTREVSRV
jgi:hypothetical protein